MHLALRSRPPYIGSYVIYLFSLPFAPQIRFNCLNKTVSAHPSLYCAQIHPYLLSGLSERLRPTPVLPMRSRYASFALRCFRAGR